MGKVMRTLLLLLLLFTSCKDSGPFDVVKNYQTNFFRNSFQSFYGHSPMAQDAYEYFDKSTYYILLAEEMNHHHKTAQVKVLIETVKDRQVKYFLFGKQYKQKLGQGHEPLTKYAHKERSLASETLKIPVIYSLKLVGNQWQIVDVDVDPKSF
jgi:hypothetical protein